MLNEEKNRNELRQRRKKWSVKKEGINFI